MNFNYYNRLSGKLYLLVLAWLLGGQLSAQEALPPVDTLPGATISAFASPTTSPTRVPAPIGLLETEELRSFGEQSLLPAMNRLPGVRFEERAPGSYRISIRGSTLRAPFGVRNVKVYWNGIPLTEPGGDTQLNFLDPGNIDRAEVIRGPAGSFYGAGTAGTLLLQTDTLGADRQFNAFTGSYDTWGGGARVQDEYGRLRTDGRFHFLTTDGYREHSSLRRYTGQASLYFDASGDRYEQSDLALHVLITDLRYDLPGGLTEEQYRLDDRQARPGSAETNASINYKNALVALTSKTRQGRWTNEGSIYGTGFYFDHPFNFDYKRETNLGYGGRFQFGYTLPLAASVLNLTAGAEGQGQFRMANNFENTGGFEAARPGALNFSDEIFSTQFLSFLQLRWQTASDWTVIAGGSINALRYDVDRTFDANGAAGMVESAYDPILSPRLAVLKGFGRTSVYASIAEGFSPPTLDEFRTNEGSLNTVLAPERGTNYELGGRYARGGLYLEATAYYFALRQTISSFTDGRGTRLFRNAGETDQRGIELAASYDLRPGLNLYTSYTYTDYTYANYVRDGEDVSGQRLPGTAPHVFNLVADYRPAAGFYGQFYFTITDDIPLNDANTVFGEEYYLIRARAGWRFSLARSRVLEVYVNGENLLDEKLSYGNDLNPRFGGRYFQPGAGRNVLVGVRWGGGR